MATVTDVKDVIGEIKARVSVVEVAAQYGEVKRRGRLHVCRCLCGENSDRNPSFTLYDDDNHYHCYACSRHGSVIDLVMLVENFDLKNAIERLRQQYLIEKDMRQEAPRRVIRPTPPSSAPRRIRDDVRALMDAATNSYESALRRSPDALGYLRKRGLNDETIRLLRIGYADGGLGRALFGQGIDIAVAAQAGLITASGEKFRGRIVFPVFDTKHTPVWMIGRAVSDEVKPKYDGLPDGLVHKRPMVLGRPEHGAIVVEGAFDFAAAVQWSAHSLWLIVALLGTAHERVTHKLAQVTGGKPIVLMLDQDKSGKEASLKLALALRECDVPVKVVMDADRQRGVEAYVTATLPTAGQLDVEGRKLLEAAEKEHQLVQTFLEHDFATWVCWNKAKDLGDLLRQGQQGQARFEHALAHPHATGGQAT